MTGPLFTLHRNKVPAGEPGAPTYKTVQVYALNYDGIGGAITVTDGKLKHFPLTKFSPLIEGGSDGRIWYDLRTQ